MGITLISINTSQSDFLYSILFRGLNNATFLLWL